MVNVYTHNKKIIVKTREVSVKEKDAQIDCKMHEIKLFVEKEDGSYSSIKTGSYLVKNYFSKFLENMAHFQQTAFLQLTKNEISPIAYYMIQKEMTPHDIAVRVGLRTSKVKKHLQPKYFKHVTVEQAIKYAGIFGIPIANLFQISTNQTDDALMEQHETHNPYIVTLDNKKGKK